MRGHHAGHTFISAVKVKSSVCVVFHSTNVAKFMFTLLQILVLIFTLTPYRAYFILLAFVYFTIMQLLKNSEQSVALLTLFDVY